MHHLVLAATAAAAFVGSNGVAPDRQAPASSNATYTRGSTRVDGRDYPYLLLEPLAAQRDREQPLVVFLHGAGERGEDNSAQQKWLPEVLAAPAMRQRLPCYLLAVQCPRDARWVEVPWDDAKGSLMPAEASPAMRAVMQATDDLLARRPIDRARVYLTGLSMGGYGCWDLACRQPERFAAMLAVCGGGDPEQATQLVGMPIAVYHGSADTTVPVVRSRAMVAALRSLGVAVDYHELPGVGHDAWKVAYGPDGALDWMFRQDQRQQQRGAWRQPSCVPAVDRWEPGVGRFVLGANARCLAVGAARDPATVLLDVLANRVGRKLPLVAGEPAIGDLVVQIDAAQTADVVITIGTTVVVSGRNARALHRGAGLAAQLLVGAGWAGQQGTFTVSAAASGGCIELANADTWTAVNLRDLLLLAWGQGVARLAGPGLDTLAWLTEAQRTAVRGLARRAAIELSSEVTGSSPLVRFRLQTADGSFVPLADLLRQRWPPDVGAGRFLVRIGPVAPAVLLAALRTRLPAIAERAQRAASPVHIGGFCSRLGGLLRPAAD